MNKMESFFSEWVEPDFAQYFLACVLGMLEYEPSLKSYYRHSHYFLSRSEMGDILYQLLEEMVASGILETNEYKQYRWNRNFSGFR
jgi:hypothetical protein